MFDPVRQIEASHENHCNRTILKCSYPKLKTAHKPVVNVGQVVGLKKLRAVDDEILHSIVPVRSEVNREASSALASGPQLSTSQA